MPFLLHVVAYVAYFGTILFICLGAQRILIWTLPQLSNDECLSTCKLTFVLLLNQQSPYLWIGFISGFCVRSYSVHIWLWDINFLWNKWSGWNWIWCELGELGRFICSPFWLLVFRALAIIMRFLPGWSNVNDWLIDVLSTWPWRRFLWFFQTKRLENMILSDSLSEMKMLSANWNSLIVL